MRTKRRNLSLAIPDPALEILRELAGTSKMALARYASLVLQDAAANRMVFSTRPEALTATAP
jgi:hypothetical protein